MDNQIDQPRNPNDLLIMQNVDNEDHEWQYDAIKTPLPYYIRAGETRELPFYIARHGVEKLIDKMLIKQNRLHTNPIFRNELREKIVLGLKHINFIREKTPNEIALEELQRKKDTDPYEELLKKREIEAEKIRTQAVQVAQSPLLETIGTPVQPITPPASSDTGPIAPIAPTNVPVAPASDAERQNVYNLLTTKLHLDLSHQATKEKLDSMSIESLKAEFASELPELTNPQVAIVPDTKASLTQDGMPLTPLQPLQPRPAQPAVPAPVAAQISMNPASVAAPLLDQQLAQVH